PVVGDREEAAAHRRAYLAPVLARAVLDVQDPDQAGIGQDPDHGRVPGEDPDVTVEGLGDHHPGHAGPDLAVRGHQRHSHAHITGPPLAPGLVLTAAPAPGPCAPRPRSRRT